MIDTQTFRSRYDAIVVGGRAAGAATATLLAQKGLDVLVLERTRYGSDTLSTHALMRAGVLQLHRWGVLEGVVAAGTPAVRTTSFHYGDEIVAVPIKPRDGVDALYAPRRTALDALLQDAAGAAGARIVHGVRVVDLVRNDQGRVAGVVVEDADKTLTTIASEMVIGADGARSTVARLVGAETLHAGVHASGVVYGYWQDLGLEGYNWYWGAGVGGGAIPTNDGDTCVFVGTSQRRFRDEVRSDIAAAYPRLLAACSPELAAAVAGSRQSGGFKAFAGQEGFMRRSWGPGWALVGDAAYFKDPITAHGISDALRDAELLARALGTGSERALAGYQATRDELSLGLFEISDAVASFDWSLDEVKALHLDLSREMGREVDFLTRLDDRAGPAAGLARTA